MIEEVMRWKTEDGELFDSVSDARHHASKIKDYEKCLSILGDVRPDFDGSTYVQHTEMTIVMYIFQVGQWLRAYANDDLADRWFREPRGPVGRMLDDSPGLGSKLYHRLCKIDAKHREWGQQYFVRNPNEQAVAK